MSLLVACRGLLTKIEIAVNIKVAADKSQGFDYTILVGVVMLAIALTFVWRSFYSMRIPKV